jgi:hypothetical protein
MERNQKLGNITRIVMSLLDYRFANERLLNNDLRDNELTYMDLRDNKEFFNGVMSAFHMDPTVEKWVWGLINSSYELPPLEPELDVIHDAEPENVDTTLEEVDVEDVVVY